MLKPRVLASIVLLAAISISVPAGLILKQDAVGAVEQVLEGNVSAAVSTAPSPLGDDSTVEYAMELGDTEESGILVSPLRTATENTVVSLPKVSSGELDATAPLHSDDPVVQSILHPPLTQEEEKQAAKTGDPLDTVQYDVHTPSASNFVGFDINNTIFPVTPEEVEMLMYVVQAEAGGGTLEAKRIVTFSITNRVICPTAFPNTLYEVLHARRQFSTIQNYYSKKKVPNETTIQAVQEVLMGACEDNSQNCMYFYCTGYPVAQSVVDWFENDLVYLYTVGCDRFFTDPS